jgi:proteasome lid subunit RPN8/RPN11
MNEISQVRISISRSQYEKMLSDVKHCMPEEACGIVAGREGRAIRVYVITNALHSPTAFRMDPQEQIRAFLDMEEDSLEMLAIYHSHPTGPDMPSETDRNEFAYPGVITLIWYPNDEDWQCRAYLIDKDRVIETGLLLLDGE